ncbi:MAG: hypothetical protein ABI442_08170 [Gemmatimonadaceae bacterium]
MKSSRLIVAVWIGVASSCGGSGESVVAPPPAPDCTANALAGIAVTTVDSATGSTLTATGTVVFQDAPYFEKAIALPPTYFGAFERAGTYLVLVTLPGYQPWAASNVVVRAGPCHVVPVQLTARLVR